MKKRIVIVDDDEKYIANLEMILLSREEDLIDIEVVTGEYFQEFFSQSRNINCLIIDERFFSSVIQKQSIDFVFVLSYSQKEETFNVRRCEKIYKYSSVKEIFHKIIGKLGLPVDSRKNSFGEHTNGETQVIMVYSPVGGVGKTSVSLALSYQLSMLNKNVLYINIDDIQNYQLYLHKEGYIANGFERVLHVKDEQILSVLEGAVWHLEFDSLKPFRGVKQSYGVDSEHYVYLVNKLRQNSLYDYVIIDGDSSFGKFNGEIMASSDKILMVTNATTFVTQTVNTFLGFVRASEREKMVFVCNRYNQEMFNSEEYAVVEYLPEFNVSLDRYIETWYESGVMKETALMLV